MSTELALRDGQSAFDAKQLAALEQLGVQGASRADQAIFFHQCMRTGLDPFARQVYMIERQGKQTIQTGIDGFRLIARRAVDKRGETLGYQPDQWCGEDGQWRDVWLGSTAPLAARVTVLRDGQPFPGIALLSEYRATKRDGSLTAMWANKPVLMLAKCAEALALRRAFPQDLSGLYTTDEMGTEVADVELVVDVDKPSGTRRMSRAPLKVAEPEPPAADPESAPDDPPADDADAFPMISTAQQKKMHALYNELGVTDRDERLADASAFLGDDVATSNELTRDDASRLIDYLELRSQGPDPS